MYINIIHINISELLMFLLITQWLIFKNTSYITASVATVTTDVFQINWFSARIKIGKIAKTGLLMQWQGIYNPQAAVGNLEMINPGP